MDLFKINRAFKGLSLMLAMLTVGIGASSCKLLKMAAKSQKHAAIAYDENTGGWGYSFNQLTEGLAKDAATKKCPTCTVRLAWNQGCGALAQSTTKKNIMNAATGEHAPRGRKRRSDRVCLRRRRNLQDRCVGLQQQVEASYCIPRRTPPPPRLGGMSIPIDWARPPDWSS